MTIKVVIERTVKPDKRDELLEILKEMRPKAIQQPGHVKGETLCSIENPNTHMIISTWHRGGRTALTAGC
ncbi:MAG: antibiotic biosynthesis monooxygenase family protein [Chloroflexota bacterium]|nr:antibiotic biosynthesis monooxygenase family protein [Chloroflexota bacterium]